MDRVLCGFAVVAEVLTPAEAVPMAEALPLVEALPKGFCAFERRELENGDFVGESSADAELEAFAGLRRSANERKLPVLPLLSAAD